MQDIASLRERVETWRGIEQRARDQAELIELAIEEEDDSFAGQAAAEQAALETELERLEFELQLSGEYDHRDAILAIHAGAGVDGEDGVAVVVLARELELELEAFQLGLEGGLLGGGLPGEGVVLLLDGQLDELGLVAGALLDAAPGLDALTQGGDVLHDGAGVVGVVPEGGLGGAGIEVGESVFRQGEVKDAPACRRRAGGVLGPGSGAGAWASVSQGTG